jgi:HK97 family phage portal protein
MLTRELWIVARGFRNGSPEELVFIHPYNIQVIEDPESQWPNKIYTNINGDRRYYQREPAEGGRYRYFDKTGLNEIFPYISERNVAGNSGYFRGTSPLLSIKDELMSYSASVVGNTASIENAGRPSGIISPKDDNLTEKQYDDLEESMETIAGALNNGKIVLLPASVEAAFPQWAPKDMDYATLQKNVKMNIWNLYYLPFPMVSDTNQSYNNTENAELSFYDNSVNAIWSDVADAIKWALQTRYDLEGWMISYNEFEVPALKRRAVRNMKELTESQVLSVNEIRASGGYEETDNGEAILVNSGKTPLSAVVEAPEFTPPPKGTEQDPGKEE